jgi:HD-GYP domain-containing protein (c-di-GMP phosphodiesterase class II)
MSKPSISSPDSFVGRRINKNIYTAKNTLLLPAFSLITEECSRLLSEHDIHLGKDDLEPDIEEMEQVLDESVKEVKRIFEDIQQSGQIPFETIKRTLLPSLCDLSKNVGILGFMLTLQKADDYTYKHSTGVAMLAVMMGEWLNLPAADIPRLAMAGLLHDVGKLYISPAILQKPGELSGEEFAQIKRHPELGYELLMRQPAVDHRAALVALQHHEREDGKGYPYGHKGCELDLWSKIVAVADVFHAMTSKRVYKDALPLYQVLRNLWIHAYGAMDANIVHCFMEKLMIYLIGCEVVLSNGQEAKIIMLNNRNPVNPLVHTGGRFIDLSTEPNLYIEKLLKA